MTTSIVKFNKNGLDTDTQCFVKKLFIENASDFTILQYADNTKSYSYTVPFEISVADIHAPYIKEEMVLVIREKVDLTAQGPNDTIIKNIGKDLGGEENIDSSPRRPKDLPPGFQEVLRL